MEQTNINDYMAGTYFNTTSEGGSELMAAQEVCGEQETVVAALFCSHGWLSPSQAHHLYPDDATPLTSIRRAITVLTNKGILQKTDDKVTGIYGKPEYIWKYRKLT